MDGYQRNRVYQLIVGDSRSTDAFEIQNDLQIQFDISKSTDNKRRTNSAAIEITNLNPDQVKLLDTDYPAASFSVGYLDVGNIKRIFGGQVTNVSTRKNGISGVITINSSNLPISTFLCRERLNIFGDVDKGPVHETFYS